MLNVEKGATMLYVTADIAMDVIAGSRRRDSIRASEHEWWKLAWEWPGRGSQASLDLGVCHSPQQSTLAATAIAEESMGNLCSKAGTTTSEDAVLRPSAANQAPIKSTTSNGVGRLGFGGRSRGQGHVLGGEASAPQADDPRAAAAQAAEERLKSV